MIRPIRSDCIKYIHGLQNPRHQRNLVALPSIGISRSVQTFVMMPHDRQNQTEGFQRRADSLTDRRRCFIIFHSSSVRGPGLVRIDWGTPILSYVVKYSAAAQRYTRFLP
jgi:hypothetical protein